MRQGKERSRIKVELKIYSVLLLFLGNPLVSLPFHVIVTDELRDCKILLLFNNKRGRLPWNIKLFQMVRVIS